MKPLIELKDVTKQYHSGEQIVVAVQEVSFTINEGAFVVIVGPSGAGKSTILNLLGGMDTVTTGRIFVDGMDISHYNDSKLTEYRAKKVGFVFQFYNLIPSLSVLENVALVKEVAKDSLDATKVLELVGLGDRKKQFPTQISGGEQQRVSIARAVCKNPKLLLCDEPTGALDTETGIKILTLLQDMSHKHHKTVIVVTHNQAIAQAADQVIRFRDGKITEVCYQDCPLPMSEVTW